MFYASRTLIKEVTAILTFEGLTLRGLPYMTTMVCQKLRVWQKLRAPIIDDKRRLVKHDLLHDTS